MLGSLALRVSVLTGVALLGEACGSRTDLPRRLDGGAPPSVQTERCNGIDDDGVNGVDDPFRDSQGRYVGDANCGACNQPCAPRSAAELVAHCQIVDQVPLCVATACATGFATSHEGRCEPINASLCLPCANENDCGALRDATCTVIAGESRCSVACTLGCPSGYRCDDASAVCVPNGGSCSCTAGQSFDLACAVASATPSASDAVCVGHARCEQGVLSACETSPEICDHVDNDCDGLIDEGFRDERGAYSLDQANCGECGVSCIEDTGTDLQLACGGDPFAPSCTLACPDARDGVQVGDLLDGDLDVSTGCECKVSATHDEPGPSRAADAALDVNCDGADGDVTASFYVAPDGDDTYPGSPTRPLRSISIAMQRAFGSRASASPRVHVFVAGGTYTEALQLAEGVFVHGGYRRDFRALNVAKYAVDVRAPSTTTLPGGAALFASGVGITPTSIEGITLHGVDATRAGAPTVAAYVEHAGENLTLNELVLIAGVPGDGSPGFDGPAGAAPSTQASVGQLPRAAIESSSHQCIAGIVNTVQGGAGGVNACAGGSDVGGGSGGSSTCPAFANAQGAGAPGRSSDANTASGGSGGQDSEGPIDGLGAGCVENVCCGLADFSVPPRFVGASFGSNGHTGTAGGAGSGCGDPRGIFVAGAWNGGSGSAGSAGSPGGGGGGGGAGGGVQMDFTTRLCEFNDGLGGGGGGGGAGGCGGSGGQQGTSGGPSAALLVVDSAAFTLRGVTLTPSHGGRGGPGGAGGDGGQGGVGAAGGAIAPELRTTPTLAGTYPGARGGSGGAGGPGGGGGGGCGGASVGIWVAGSGPASAWQSDNRFVLGSGGEGGAGGSGAQGGSSGARGEALDVLVQR